MYWDSEIKKKTQTFIKNIPSKLFFENICRICPTVFLPLLRTIPCGVYSFINSNSHFLKKIKKFFQYFSYQQGYPEVTITFYVQPSYFCNLFLVSHAIGCNNRDIVEGLCSLLMRLFYYPYTFMEPSVVMKLTQSDFQQSIPIKIHIRCRQGEYKFSSVGLFEANS